MKKGRKSPETVAVGKKEGEGIWIFGDIRTEALKKTTAGLLKQGTELSEKRGLPCSLILLGSKIGPHLSYFEESGPDNIYFIDHPRLASYRQETYCSALEYLVQTHHPEIFLMLANDCGRELAPRLAARLQTGLCADCIQLDIDPETGLLIQTVPAFGDHIYGRIITPNKRPQMATVRPGVHRAASQPSSAGQVQTTIHKIPLPKDIRKERIKCLSSKRDSSAGNTLEDARTVICGGRGMGSHSRFHNLYDLAALIGADVGATRPAVHAHWIEEDRMIGQTGCTIQPEMLLLFGISGAIQFSASIQEAKYIIAVNRDPKATIFSIADLGIQADVKQLLPELKRRIQRVLIEQYGKSADEICPQDDTLRCSGIGPRIKGLRQERELDLNEVARALEIGPQDLKKIEENEVTPPVSLLLRTAKFFQVDPAPFLSIAQGARADQKRMDSFTKRTQSYSYRTLTPGADQKHLRAFQVIIDPKKDHKMVEYKHEGEEFVYVQKGEAEIKVGEDVHHLKKGDTLHFEASIPHHLRNPSAQKAELVVVLYTP